MNVLVDTNVLSETTRPRPDANVLRWLAELDEDRAFVSIVTLAELRRGVLLLDPGRRRTMAGECVDRDLRERFSGRILPVNEAVAGRWAELMAEKRRRSITISAMDGLIAATASCKGLSVATRNTPGFSGLGLVVVNPWVER